MRRCRFLVLLLGLAGIAVLGSQAAFAGGPRGAEARRTGAAKKAKVGARGVRGGRVPSIGSRAGNAQDAPARFGRVPKALGEGYFSKAYRSWDGRYVIKKVKDRIAYRQPLSPRRRVELANRTVQASEALRKSGFPVPRSFVPRGRGGVVVQEYAGGNLQSELRAEARERALAAARGLVNRAREVEAEIGTGRWTIDDNLWNFRFDESGRVTAWIDPVMPISAAESSRIWGGEFWRGVTRVRVAERRKHLEASIRRGESAPVELVVTTQGATLDRARAPDPRSARPSAYVLRGLRGNQVDLTALVPRTQGNLGPGGRARFDIEVIHPGGRRVRLPRLTTVREVGERSMTLELRPGTTRIRVVPAGNRDAREVELSWDGR